MSYTNPNNYAYGLVQGPLLNIFTPPQVVLRDPGLNDKSQIGAEWVNPLNNHVWVLTSFVNGTPTWTLLGPIAAPTGLAYVTDATGTLNLTVNTVNYLTNVGMNTDTLPAGATVGQIIWLIDNNAAAANSGITVRANAGAKIIDANDQVSTAGGTMVFENLGIGATPLSIVVELMCTVAGTEWTVVGSNYQGVAH